VLGAIVLLLIPLSALGSSGDSKHVAIKPIQSPPSATTNVPPPSSTTASVAGAEPLTVARVVDGDTVKLSDGRTVQLAQISAPSVASGDCYANHARSTLRTLVAGHTVRLAREPVLPRTDRYHHVVAYLIARGQNVNLVLVKKGAAAPYFYFNHQGRYASKLMASASAARTSHRGLWGACSKTVLNPVAQVHTRGGKYHPPSHSSSSGGSGNCTPGYSPCLIWHGGADYDCAGGSGNGPYYTAPGVVYTVSRSDPYRLDSNGNGKGCENSGGSSGGGGGPGGGGGTGSDCTPGYSPCLVYHGGADYDCYGGSGNGPYYTAPGVVYTVTGSDPYGLDSNGNGLGCE